MPTGQLGGAVGSSNPTQAEPQIVRRLSIYRSHLDEFEVQLHRIKRFSDRIEGVTPPASETDKPASVQAGSALAEFEELNLRLHGIVTSLNDEANRLEGIG